MKQNPPAPIEHFSSTDEVFDYDGPVTVTDAQLRGILREHGQTVDQYHEETIESDYAFGTAQHLLSWLGY